MLTHTIHFESCGVRAKFLVHFAKNSNFNCVYRSRLETPHWHIGVSARQTRFNGRLYALAIKKKLVTKKIAFKLAL